MSNSPRKLFGFTLLELLVVMAIIGILAAIGIASYGTVQSKARDARRKSDLENVARALEMYYNDNGAYPAIGSTSGEFSFSDATTDVKFVHGTSTDVVYMQKTPKETKSGYGYLYEPVPTAGANKGYRLYARLENLEDAKVARDATYSPGAYGQTCGTKMCNYVITSTNENAPAVVEDL